MVLFGHPWIAAWVVEWQLRAAGGSIEGPRQVYYERIVWHDVRWSSDGIDLNVERVELGLIPRFIASWLHPQEAIERERPFFFAQGVDLLLTDTDPPPQEGEAVVPDLPGWHQQVTEIVAVAERWLPPVAVNDLRVRSDFFSASVGSGIWNGWQFALKEAHFESPLELQVSPGTAHFDTEIRRQQNGLEWHLRGEIGPLEELRAQLVTTGGSRRLQANGSVLWAGGRLEGGVVWMEEGWMPDAGQAQGVVRDFTGTPLGREDLPEVATRLQFAFEGDRFDLEMEGSGVWLSPDEELGEVSWALNLLAAADEMYYQVDTLEIELPWIQLSLEEPVRVNRQTLTPSGSASLQWGTDLAVWPWKAGEGTAAGRANLVPLEDREGLAFEVQGDARLDKMEILPEPYQEPGEIRFYASGRGNREALELDQWQIDADRWGRVAGSGTWQWEGEYPFQGRMEGIVLPDTLKPWIPDWLKLQSSIWLETTFSGGLEAGWNHHGSLRAAEVRLLEEGDDLLMDLDVVWEGSATGLDSWTLVADSVEQRIESYGAVAWSADSFLLTVEGFDEFLGETLRWHLITPLRVGTGMAEGEGLLLEGLSLRNAAGAGHVTGEGRFSTLQNWRFQIDAASISAAEVEGWFPVPNDQWMIDYVSISGNASGEVMQAKADLYGIWRTRSGDNWLLRLDGSLDESGFLIDQLELRSPREPWLQAQAAIPFPIILTTDESGEERWTIEWVDDRNVYLDLVVTANEPLPRLFREMLPFDYENITIKASFDGSINDPAGRIDLLGTSLSFDTPIGERLVLQEPSLRGRVRAEQFEIEELGFRIQESQARAEASLIVDRIPWESLGSTPLADSLAEMRVNLRLDAFPFAAVSPFLPDLMESGGTLSADLNKYGPAEFSGTVSWQGVSLRPLPNGSVPRNIRGQARLEGQQLKDLELRASISGRTVRVTGEADLSYWPEPLFDFQINADRLDLVRQLDLILRARGDLRVARTSVDVDPLISGSLTLEDSLLLRDLRDFTRQGTAGVTRRPPYFAVEEEPLDSWRLDVGIRGEDFMRVRTPIFNGLITANFQLQGTLGNPVLIGEALIEEGAVLFPFARIPITMGRGSISLADPHTLQLYVQGRGVAFGYDVVMQLEGSADNPDLFLSSPQGLSSEEIILMLAAGAVPAAGDSVSTAERAGRMALYLGQDFLSVLMGGSGDGASRIEIRSGDGFSPFRRSNQIIQYHLNNTWSILGENDDWGDYNVDVKWNVHRR